MRGCDGLCGLRRWKYKDSTMAECTQCPGGEFSSRRSGYCVECLDGYKLAKDQIL